MVLWDKKINNPFLDFLFDIKIYNDYNKKTSKIIRLERFYDHKGSIGKENRRT